MMHRHFIVWSHEHGVESPLHQDELSAELAQQELRELAAYRGIETFVSPVVFNTDHMATGDTVVMVTHQPKDGNRR